MLTWDHIFVVEIMHGNLEIGRNFVDDIFKLKFLQENRCLFINFRSFFFSYLMISNTNLINPLTLPSMAKTRQTSWVDEILYD